MDLGKYQLVLSVSVILAAAVVALLFDYLKRNNEQLRQANREMKARRSQELRHVRLRENAVQAGPPPTPVARSGLKPSVEARVAKAPAAKTEQRQGLVTPPATTAEPKAEPAVKMGLRVTATETPKKPAASAPAASSTSVPKVGPARDWSSLLKSARPEDRPAPSLAEQALGALAERGAKAAGDSTLPAGFHSELVLNGLLQRNLKVTGTAVSIGASFAAEVMPDAIHSFVQSLLRAADFGARRGNEFVLILNEELGAASQRRLNNIAQRLWEFQIESMEAHGTSFSWGGVEVHEIPLEEALSSASERMAETKRNRKILPIGARERRAELRRAM